LIYFFTASRPGCTVVGLDRDFFRLLVAKRYVAPAASFVCVPADGALPFCDSALSAIFASDAFHLFLHRALTLREMRRVLSERGLIALACFGNAQVEPREGYELTVSGYRRLFADFEHVLVGEDTLLANYLERRTPDMTRVDSDEELGRQKWLSVAAAHSRKAFAGSATFSTFPHAEGRLQLNPIYAVDARSAGGDLELRLEFPSEWYRFENGSYLRYAPERVRVPGDVMRALETRQQHPALDELVRQFVVIGMPDRYQTATLPAT
jgi:SAM-dependent methyltransferase